MQNLIESLLAFSRTNLSEVVFEKTDLNQTLIEVQATLHDSILQTKTVIESESLPTVNAVPIHMHQLFLNLISNSIKYSKQDTAPHIKITEYEGTGIGLAICKKIMQAHNGTITATGKPGLGCTFIFFLPAHIKT